MLHLFVHQYLFLKCITEFLHWNYHWVFLWFCRLYSDGLALGVWFMTSCCCLVEFGFSCFNHASIESWFANYSVLGILHAVFFHNRTTTSSAPSYFHLVLWIYIPSTSLRSASERRLVVPSQRGSKSLSRTFSFTTLGWWNDLSLPPPPPYLECWISVNLKATTENSSLSTLLDFIKKKNFTFSLSLSPSLASSYLFEQCLRLGVTSTSSVCLPLQD